MNIKIIIKYTKKKDQPSHTKQYKRLKKRTIWE
jgi:hypothetical protein